MYIQLPSDPMFQPDFHYDGELPDEVKEYVEALEDWLSDLLRSLEDYFKKAYTDLSMGTTTRRVVSAVPGVSDLTEGEIVLYDNEVDTRRLYTRMNGVVRYVALT